jgi:hypothetical protein
VEDLLNREAADEISLSISIINLLEQTLSALPHERSFSPHSLLPTIPNWKQLKTVNKSPSRLFFTPFHAIITSMELDDIREAYPEAIAIVEMAETV